MPECSVLSQSLYGHTQEPCLCKHICAKLRTGYKISYTVNPRPVLCKALGCTIALSDAPAAPNHTLIATHRLTLIALTGAQQARCQRFCCEGETNANSARSIARPKAAALFTHSSNSASGTLSATKPAPACAEQQSSTTCFRWWVLTGLLDVAWAR